MASQWYYKTADQEFGPLSPRQMRKAVECGMVERNTLVRRDDSKWFKAKLVSGLLPPADTNQTNPRQKPTLDPVAAAELELSLARGSWDSSSGESKRTQRTPKSNSGSRNWDTPPPSIRPQTTGATSLQKSEWLSTRMLMGAFALVATLVLVLVVAKLLF